MENQKLVFVLLIVTVVLSICSTLFIFSLNVGSSANASNTELSKETTNSGNIQFVIEGELDEVIENETE